MDKNTPPSSHAFQIIFKFSTFFLPPNMQNFQYSQNSQNFFTFKQISTINQVFHMLILCFCNQFFNPRMASQQPNAEINSLPIPTSDPKKFDGCSYANQQNTKKNVHFFTLNFLLIPHNQKLRRSF